MKPEKSAFDLRVHLTCDCGTCLRLLRENARLMEELAAAEERFQAERRLREELEDKLFIMPMPGNSHD